MFLAERLYLEVPTTFALSSFQHHRKSYILLGKVNIYHVYIPFLIFKWSLVSKFNVSKKRFTINANLVNGNLKKSISTKIRLVKGLPRL